MIDFVENLLASLTTELYLYICIGIIGLTFIVCLILALTTGSVNKFKKYAKKFIIDPSKETLKETIENMPRKVAHSLEKDGGRGHGHGHGHGKCCKREGEGNERHEHHGHGGHCGHGHGKGHGRRLPIDSIVALPFASSVAQKMPFVVMMVSIFVSLIAIALSVVDGVAVILIVAVVGLLLTLLSIIISSSIYSGALKTCEQFEDALHDLAHGKKMDDSDDEDDSEEIEENIAPVVEENYESSQVAIESEPISYSMPNDYNVSKDYEPVVEFPNTNSFSQEPIVTQEPIISQEPIVTQEPIISQEPIVTQEPALVVDEPIATSSPIVTPPPATTLSPSEQLRARTEAARAERAKAQQDAVANARTGELSSANEFFIKVDNTIAKGATMPEIKALAMELSQERVKQINQTPELRKKFSETQMKLLGAMKTARK